jgi:glycerate kinase
MRIVLAPDKFKDCLSAVHVAQAMAAGVRRARPDVQIDCCPMADGGEGTVAALVAATAGRIETRRVTGPLAEMKVDAAFGILGDGRTAVIEMAAAAGLSLLKPTDRDPMRTTTFGVGQLLMAAAQMGVSDIILGIGGSATIDGGIGCAQACDLPVILEDGQPVAPGEPLVGADLPRVVLIKHGRGSPVEKLRIIVAADVTNPLCGPNGAAVVYGPQKGATPDQIKFLDAALLQLTKRTGKMDFAALPGAGAAGGMGFAMAAFFGATLRPGIDIVIDATHLRDRLRGADLCLSGEGRLDRQSLAGKTVVGVARLCQEMAVPCIAIAGSVEDGLDALAIGAIALHAIRDGHMTMEESKSRATELIEAKTAQIIAAGASPRSGASG